MLRRNSVIVLTFVLLASSLVSHRVRADVRGVSIKVASISMGRLTTNSLTESKGALIGNGKVRKVVVKVKLAQN